MKTTWSTQKHYIRQRTLVYGRINKGVKQNIGDQKQNVNYILPSNKQTNGEGQPGVGIVLKNVHQL